jgi:hypothetical protein
MWSFIIRTSYYILGSSNEGWAGHGECRRAVRSEYKVLVGRCERVKPFMGLRHRWKKN